MSGWRISDRPRGALSPRPEAVQCPLPHAANRLETAPFRGAAGWSRRSASISAPPTALWPCCTMMAGHHAAPRLPRCLPFALCFWTEPRPARPVLHHAAGPEAITAYLEDPLDSRLIMSMKTYLAQKSFTETRIFGHRFTLERLIGWFLAHSLPTSLGTARHRRPPRALRRRVRGRWPGRRTAARRLCRSGTVST